MAVNVAAGKLVICAAIAAPSAGPPAVRISTRRTAEAAPATETVISSTLMFRSEAKLAAIELSMVGVIDWTSTATARLNCTRVTSREPGE
jgi:hypothetical protein